MVLRVDYNRVDRKGRTPATLRGSLAFQVCEGDLVIIEDGEGTRCKAYVEEVHRNLAEAKAVAYLALIPGSVDRSERIEWVEGDRDEVVTADLTELADRRLAAG